tara:strand:+ start:19 stop:264 length:246 start_codon:yes stop_codon:yes gene_type:complete
MNKLNFKLKLNKIFERNFKIRKKMLDVERLTKEIKEIQDENYISTEFLLDVIVRDTKKNFPETCEVNGRLPTWNKVETKGE